MIQGEQQGKGIEALKALNNTIVTSRIYPPDAPQVVQVLERGYQGLMQFFSRYGPLSLSFSGTHPRINLQPLSEEVLSSFPNLVVYRQLRHLGLPRLVLGAELDKLAFAQLVSVFNAPVEKIKSEGGGLAYVTSLGLAAFFPVEEEQAGQELAADERQPERGAKVRPELVASLLGHDLRPAVVAELVAKMAVPETAVAVATAAICELMLGVQRQKRILATPAFSVLLARIDELLPEEGRQQFIVSLAGQLAAMLKDPSLAALLAQRYPDGFGAELYQALPSALSMASFAGVVDIYNEKLTGSGELVDRPAAEPLRATLEKLLQSAKGKQYLGSKKARELIQAGERQRKARRLEAGLKALLQGQSEVLASEELLLFLPRAVIRLDQAGRNAEVSRIVAQLAASLRPGGMAIGPLLLPVLVELAEGFLAADRPERLAQMLNLLREAVLRAETADACLEKAVVFLLRMMYRSWAEGEPARGDELLLFIHRLRNGELVRPASFRKLVAKVQDREIQRKRLPQLLSQCLATPREPTLRRRLTLQGPVAIRFLVDSLINAEQAEERLLLIDVLTEQSGPLPGVIHERLPEHMPWYGKRNLIKLLGECGGEDDAEKVLPFLRHDDLRVQREAFLCIYKIGGRGRKRLLLAGLETAAESITVQIVAALAPFGDEEVAARLSQMLIDQDQLATGNRGELLLQLLETLSRCANSTAARGVESFLEIRGSWTSRKIPEQVWQAAEKARDQIDRELQDGRKKIIHAKQLRKDVRQQVAKVSRRRSIPKSISGLPGEQVVRALLAGGDKAAAGEQLLECIDQAARAGNFQQAEQLRDWLIEIDPGDLGRMITAAEILAREKEGTVERGHLEVWHALYDLLNSEESTALYHGLRHRKYLHGEVVINQGALQSTLFFINSGRVKVYAEGQGGEILLKTMGPGEIVGAAAFFEASVWTVSVAAIGTAEISGLNREKLQSWLGEYPGLDEKLAEFCGRFSRVEAFVAGPGSDRRREVRHPIAARVATVLLDSRGESTGIEATVELINICRGGLAYRQEIVGDDNARLLLGRQVRVGLSPSSESCRGNALEGEILAVKGGGGGLSVLHLRFIEPLSEQRLEESIAALRRQGGLV